MLLLQIKGQRVRIHLLLNESKENRKSSETTRFFNLEIIVLNIVWCLQVMFMGFKGKYIVIDLKHVVILVFFSNRNAIWNDGCITPIYGN